jgi:hypothetical protein
LQDHYPELVPRYEQLYRRSYAPAAVGSALGRTVGGMVRAFGGRRAGPYMRGHKRPDRPRRSSDPQQLTLT